MNIDQNIADAFYGKIVLAGPNGCEYIHSDDTRTKINHVTADTLSNQSIKIADLAIGYIAAMNRADTFATLANQRLFEKRDIERETSTESGHLSDHLWEKMESLGMTAKQFDAWIESIGGDFEHITLKKRCRKWTVSMRYEITVEKEVEVEAFDEDEAKEKARKEWTEYEIINQLRDEFDDSCIEIDRTEEMED